MALHWPTQTRWVDDLRDVAPAALDMWNRHTRAWGGHRSLTRFLSEHYPAEWSRVRECRVKWEWYSGTGPQRKYRVEREPCRCRPFCPACNNQWQNERARGALKALRRVTPGNKPPLAFMLTLAPRKHEAPGSEWQTIAAEHHRAYMRGIFRGIEECFGEGIGAFAIYQHYGEKPFVLTHPHAHFILSGWMLRDDHPARTPYYDMSGTGGQRLREAIRCGIEREVSHGIKIPGIAFLNARIDKVEDEPERLVRLFRYNYRELIDPTKWKYPRDSAVVRIENYHDPHDVAEVTPAKLRAALEEYGQRYGKWGQPGSRVTDARFGILRDSTISDTQRRMAPDLDHRDDCVCHRCMIWSAPYDGQDDAAPLA
ncbi:MAG: hypothetical protein QOE90_2411 [Thermoplasmata archaeon]|jgi:hypothetical protein|nr:hypothetical protein [Thermoplasmata archaeon]